MTFVELTHVISRSTKVQCYTSQYVLDFRQRVTKDSPKNRATTKPKKET